MKAIASHRPRERSQWRTHVGFPGRLSTVIAERIIELGRGTFSIYVIELVCYDLRKRRSHAITRPLGDRPLVVQDGVDRQIIRNFRPFMRRRRGAFIESLLAQVPLPEVAPDAQPGLVKHEYEWVLFPPLLREIIGLRWRELAFPGISAYVTSLIRYDLLLGGPHTFFRGGDCTPEMCRSLDFETLRMFHENTRPWTYADFLAEQTAGRKLTREERDAALQRVSDALCHRAVAGLD